MTHYPPQQDKNQERWCECHCHPENCNLKNRSFCRIESHDCEHCKPQKHSTKKIKSLRVYYPGGSRELSPDEYTVDGNSVNLSKPLPAFVPDHSTMEGRESSWDKLVEKSRKTAIAYHKLPAWTRKNEETKSFIRELVAKERESAERRENTAWIAGARCQACGKKKTPNRMWSTCEDCD